MRDARYERKGLHMSKSQWRRSGKLGCTNRAHRPGDHDATCVPPAAPDDAALSLLRAIYGLCPLCDNTDEHGHTAQEYLDHGLVPHDDEC